MQGIGQPSLFGQLLEVPVAGAAESCREHRTADLHAAHLNNSKPAGG